MHILRYTIDFKRNFPWQDCVNFVLFTFHKGGHVQFSTKNRAAVTAPIIGEAALEVPVCAGLALHVPGSLVHRFGAELYQLRVAANLRPTDLARRSGLTRGYYSQLENSKRTPPPSQTVDRLCVALNLTGSVAEKLQYLAYAERVAALPGTAPAPLAKLVCSLADKAYCSSSTQMDEVYKAIEEAMAM